MFDFCKEGNVVDRLVHHPELLKLVFDNLLIGDTSVRTKRHLFCMLLQETLKKHRSDSPRPLAELSMYMLEYLEIPSDASCDAVDQLLTFFDGGGFCRSPINVASSSRRAIHCPRAPRKKKVRRALCDISN